MAELKQILQQLRDQRQYRSLETLAAAGGKPLGQLSFCANDYLNLSQNTELQEAAIYATRHYGCSSSSSRLLSGNLEIHRELEHSLANWSGCYEAALCFGSGYLANCGILQAVLEPTATVLFDKLNHASLVDGLRLARASNPFGSSTSAPGRWQRYKHCDMADLEKRLQNIQGPIWLVTDSVFSMDGDIAPLGKLAELSRKYQFRWIVDEAHATGIYGPTGAGLVQELAAQLGRGEGRLPDLITANFAKALGSYGGYCLCSGEWRDYLINFCRSLIYSTGLPPASAAAALAAIGIVRRACSGSPPPDGQPHISAGLGHKLLQRSNLFYRQLREELPENSPFVLLPWHSPIVVLILGCNGAALKAAARLRHSGILVKAIRSPSVPAGKSRLRFSLGLAHSRADLQYVAETLGQTERAITRELASE